MKRKKNIISKSETENEREIESSFYRLIFMGDSEVGKTQIINKYTNKIYKEEYFPTYSVDFQIKAIKNNGRMLNIYCIDTEGSSDFSINTGAVFIQKADAFIYVFDITSIDSLYNLKDYNEIIKSALIGSKKMTNKKVSYVVGNKCDLVMYRQVQDNEARSEANRYNAKYMEVSAKTGFNIDKLFNYVIQDIFTIEESDNRFKELKDERDNYKQMAENLQNEKLDLTKKIDEQNNENENLNKTISQLKKDKEFLTLGINKDITTLKKMHEMGLLTDIPLEKNSIIIDPKTNQIREANQEFDNKFKVLENFYDIIVDIKSVKDIEKGWEIKMTEKGEKNFMNFKDKELIRIGVIGNSNKGKSFILSRISKIDLPSGTSIKTEGLSIKYPELEGFKNREIALLDSAGLETPVLDEDRKVEEDEDEVKSINETNSGNANSKHEEITPKGETSSSNNEKKEGQNKDIFKEKSREKLITELFLQNYIINNSDILLLVVGILTYSEQKLLNKIKNVINSSKINKTLFIIHNLKTYTTKKQVQEYIKKNLKKSLTFELKKGHKISTKKEDSSGIYYFEKNSEPKIFHLIFANEGSEAGDYYNNFTLEFIERNFQSVTDLKPFDIIQTVKEGFTRLSTDIIEQTGEKPFSIDDIISNEEILKTKKIKLKEYQDIVLKRCFIDELGFSNLKGNGFVPNYNYYQIDDKLILRIEAPGNIKCETKMDYSGECTVLRVSGNKLPDKEPKNNANLYSTREFGEFSVCVLLKTAEYQIANESPKLALKNGLLICEYKLDKGNGANKIELDDEV